MLAARPGTILPGIGTVIGAIMGAGIGFASSKEKVIDRIAFEGKKKVKDEQLKSEIQSKERGTR